MDATSETIDPGAGAPAVGRFRLVRPCPARPGAAEAHLAFDTQAREQVVLMWVPPQAGQTAGAALMRLKGDVEASLRVGHPALVKARSLGMDEGRGPFLVREFVRGLSLQALPRMEVDLDAALRLLAQLAHALAAADQAGVAPAALRLDQVFVTRTGHVRLLAVGVAHAPAPSSAASAFQLARAGLELVVGAEALGPSVGNDAAPRLPDALDKGLARAFGRALSPEAAARFPTPIAFVQVLVAESPLREDQQQALLALVDQADPIREDPVVAAWLRPLLDQPGGPSEAPPAAAVEATPPAPPAPAVPAGPAAGPAVDERPEPPPGPAPARRSHSRVLRLVAVVGIAAALAAGAFVVLGRRPVERTIEADRSPPKVALEPLPPSEPAAAAPAAPAPAEREAPPTLPAATLPDEGPAAPAPEPAAEPPHAALAPTSPAAASPAPPRPAARPKAPRQFDLYKHLEKQTQGP
jgi:hypothetical protein